MQDKVFRTKTTLNLRGKLINMSSPLIMGILNFTPDSFFDGGKYNTLDKVLLQAEKLIQEGATFLDLGAYSSRPGADHISTSEECKRLLPVVELLYRNFPNTPLSIDTFRSEVAKKAIEAGGSMINDISGGDMDPNMFATIASLKVPYVLMHMKGTPQTMQNSPEYDDVTASVVKSLSIKVNQLQQMGVADIILDPGLGFGKTLTNNYTLIKQIERFKLLGLPVLIGASRKSMVHKLLDVSPKDSLNGTTVVNTLALLNGAHILRVHDVKAAMEAIKIVGQYKNS